VDTDCPGVETCNASVGDHNSGLISVIDNIQATSWTPFAEAFYNAMGYFSRTNDYPLPPARIVPTSRTEFNFTGFPVSYDTNKNPSQKPCQKNNVLVITDGMSTADMNAQVTGSLVGLATAYSSVVSAAVGSTMPADFGSQCSYSGSTSLPALTWVANHRNIKNLSMTDPNVKHCTNDLFGTTCTNDADCGGEPGVLCTNLPTRSSESIQTWVVYTNPTTTTAATLCDPYTLMNESATNGGTKLFQASSVSALSQELAAAFGQVSARAASGTAASVLASREGSGANIIQTVFYPHKVFTNTATGVDDEINWIGRLANLWYWVDPLTNNSNVREDGGIAAGSPTNTDPSGGNKILKMKADSSNRDGRDYIVNMRYDKISGVTMADRFTDPLGNGLIGTQVLPSITFENLGNLWEAGTILWERNITTAAGKRKIYTTIDGQNLLSGNFSNNAINPTPAHGTADTDNSATLAPYLQTNPTDTTEATKIISWVAGSDVAGYRPRTVKVETIDPARIARVWKLGDVVNSTPKIMSWKPLNSYGQRYNDSTYGSADTLTALTDPTHYVTTDAYKNRNVVFVGGNDGMLHAFKMGIMQQSWSGQGATEVARMMIDRTSGMLCSAGTTSIAPTCGQEMWAFIPKNALPYLKYMADPGYCHVYSIDLTPYIFDASIGGSADTADTPRTVGSWRTILIGGMRFGGACRSSTSTCTNCVKTPTSVGGADVGYSSYFALDVTDPVSPSLLWEFSDPALGFSTTGAAIARINGTTAGVSDKTTNGNWYVVLGSGPTGPISTTDHQFMGTSDQNLKLFVLDLKTGSLLTPPIDTGLQNAFAGSLVGSALDLDNGDYQDELVYVPYVTKDTASNTWTNGGVGRLMTHRNTDPARWTWNRLIDGVGPVTTAVGKIFDKTSDNLWVYFGTGRYYFVQTNTYDDPIGQGYLFGIKDPCESAIANNIACTASDPAVSWCGNGCSNRSGSPSCTLPTSCGDLTNTTDIANVPLADDANGSSFKGCYISLDPDGLFTYPPDSATNFMSERVLTDPVASSASGVVYFNSYKPYTDICMLSGKSFTWAMQYNTCGPASGLRGTVLVQSSTGAIQQIDLRPPTGDPPPGSSGGRRLPTTVEGLIGGGMSVIAPPGPTKRVVHIRER
jgi:type IV pilus assembly protein PilY1